MRIILFLAMIAMAGCTSRDKEGTSGRSESGTAIPVVYVSNYPLKYFTERIAGPLAEVRFPASSSPDPAYWHPSPEEISAMQFADLIVLNGASYERWLPSVSLPPSRMIETAKGFEDRWISLEEEVTHSHGQEGAHEHGGTSFTTWLDLTLAAEQAEAIRDAFVSRWPEHTSLFEDNALKLKADLMKLDSELTGIVGQSPRTPVIFSHPVYQYFQRRYGVNGMSAHWEPGEMPDESMWNDLTKMESQHRAKWMIWEGAPSPEIVDKLSAIGIRSVVFDPCSNEPDEWDFLGVMRKNIDAIKQVYGK